MNDIPLVSIISPCFNGEKYLNKYLDSVICQKYDNIEFIFVYDGSTDHSLEIAESYKSKFACRGFDYIVINQENKGQAAAINQGLKIFKGKYLMWVDSDDILLPENVSKKVEYLETHPECGLVLCEAEVVDSDNIDVKISDYKRKKPDGKDSLFTDLITCQNVVFCPGVIMVSRDAFEKSIPSKQIYESREGQNWQLMLPISYYFKCGYIEECLFKVVSHNESHSRIKRTTEQQLARIDGFNLLLNKVISEMNIPADEKKQYLKIVAVKIAKDRIETLSNAGIKTKIKNVKTFFHAFFVILVSKKISRRDIKNSAKFVIRLK